MTYQPSSIAKRVTKADKLAFVEALRRIQPAHLGDVAYEAGVDASIALEIMAMGVGAKKIRLTGDNGNLLEMVE